MDPKEEIKQRISVAELVGEYLELKPAGPSRFRALCPFHGEKTPSFYVSEDKQIWHCFGCQEGGDCYSFVMRMEGMDFPEALRHLGAKVGVEVKRYSSRESNERTRLLAVNELAAKFFRKVLTDAAAAAPARSYLAERGIGDALAEKFQLGFAPDAWDGFARFLATRDYTEHDGEKAGLLMRRRSGSGFIDRFRNRVMVPLCDQHGNAVGFTGRVLPGDDKGPKYMNSPETPVYHKGGVLYGLHLAKQAIKRQGCVIIVEGNLDVVASHKAGVEHVVASSGTALTQTQLELLKRYTDTIVFCFDADAAGFAAAQKGAREARALGLDVRAVTLPADAGKDPDEAVQKAPEVWRETVERSTPFMGYLIDRAAEGKDFSSIDDKRAFSGVVLPEIASIVDAVEREHWLQRAADLLHTDIAVLRRSLQPAASRQEPASRDASGAASPPISREERLGRTILGLILTDPAQIAPARERLETAPFATQELNALYKIIVDAYDTNDLSAQKSLFQRVRGELEAQQQSSLVPLLDACALQGEAMAAETSAPVSTQLNDTLRVFTEAKRRDRRKALEADIRQAEAAGDSARVERLIREFSELQ